jgi:hypothetical protein
MNKNMILLVGALVAAYFLLSKKGTGTSAAGSKPAGSNGTGTAGGFNAPKITTTGNSANINFGDIGNYATQFSKLTKTVSGLYDNYFGGSNPGYNDPTALDNVDVTDYTDTPDAG